MLTFFRPTKTLSLAAALTSTLFAAPVTAAPGDWYINPMMGYQWFDGDHDLDDEALIGIGAEYHYSEQWAVELKYLTSSPDGNSGGEDADLDQLILEYMYLLKPIDRFQPYLAAGVGHAEFNIDDGDDKDTQLLAGVGARYRFNERWSSKADVRAVYGINDSDIDQLLTLSVSYAFGAKPAKVTRAMAPAPAAVEPPKDTDGDGVFDNNDACPDTPAGAQVDNKGCAEKLARTESISLHIKFPHDRADVAPGYFAEIEKVADFMQRYPTVHSTIEGHTDSAGSAAYNKSLSQRRADAVRNVLIERYGVKPSRLDAVGYGEDKPIADNDTAEGRQKNRRVVAVFDAEVSE